MCIIIAAEDLNAVKALIKNPEYLINSELANPHGFGMAYVDDRDGKLKVFKTLLGDFETAMAILAHSRSAVLHWRVATHGAVDENNCHPFEIKPKRGDLGYLAHNGTIYGGPSDDYCSDTNFLAHSLSMSDSWLGVIKRLEDEASDDYNKFAVLSKAGLDLYGRFIDISPGLCASNRGYLGGSYRNKGGVELCD